MKIKYSLTLLVLLLTLPFKAQDIKYNTPGAGNPIIPGYFADPTIRKFGDTYYLYATTDGNGGGKGPSQVWVSKDFVNWTIMPMNWPTTLFYWAPDVMEYKDKYYLYYCQPCQIYCGVSDTPTGPWTNILGEDEAVLVPDRFVKMSITLDGQTFVDDDGSVYLYWGTWGIYPNHGCGVGKLNADLKSFSDTSLIPNTQAIDFFEAPFMFKRNGIYYFTYSSGSCHDHTYRVQYATSKVGPMGPFTFADNNPILETNEDGTIHGPGHHSILKEGDEYYIVYHRHNIPNFTRGMHRQIAVDKLTFDAEGRIEKVKATHTGVGYLQKNTNPYPNLAFGKKVRASSCYNDIFKPEYAVDDNNATLWRPESCGKEWIEIDLEKVMPVTRVWTQFEHSTSFYQYIIETSKDGKTWDIFADRSHNTQAGSPMVDTGKAKARYVRLTATGSERNGQFGAIWNIKIFNKGKEPDVTIGSFNGESTKAAPSRKGLVFDINADDYPMTEPVGRIINRTDKSQGFDAYDKKVPVRLKDGKAAFIFNGLQDFRSDFSLPDTFEGNSPYTLMTWIYMEDLSANEYLVDLTTAGGELEKVSLGYGTDPGAGIVAHNGDPENMGIPDLKKSGKWLLLAVTFDGYMEKIYLDGKLVKEKDIVLRLPLSEYITLGRRCGEKQAFKNSVHSLKLYDTPLTGNEIKDYYEQSIPDSPYLGKANETSDLDRINFAPYAESVTPQMVRVGVNLPENEYALKFFFENLTTGKKSGWVNSLNYLEYALQPDTKYAYSIKVKDTFGHIKAFDPVEITTSQERFIFVQDSFSASRDYHNCPKDSVWNGFSAYKPEEVKALAENGVLVLSSSHRNFQYHGKDNGPLLYREIEGDFLAEVKIADFSGMKNREAVGFNEGGIMVMIDDATPDKEGQELFSLGVFPHYGVGNILTCLYKDGGRPQYKNGTDWNFGTYLQVERSGDTFYFRTSKDGKEWTDIPESPVVAKMDTGKRLKVGLFQVTYTENEGYVSFDDFKLWNRK